MPLCSELCEPLSLTTVFMKGISTAQNEQGQLPLLRSTAQPLSTGSSAQFVRVDSHVADSKAADSTLTGSLVASTSIIFARRRDTAAVAGASMPQCSSPESVSTFVYPTSPVTWIDRFDTRFVTGTPLQPNPHLRSVAWVRFVDAQRGFDAQCLVALSDANLPRIYFHFNRPTPIATASMTVQLHATRARIGAVAHDFVLMEALSNAANDGFFDQSVRIWARDGTLLASSIQMVRYSDAAR
jgi:acyl-CoA thioesterase